MLKYSSLWVFEQIQKISLYSILIRYLYFNREIKLRRKSHETQEFY